MKRLNPLNDFLFKKLFGDEKDKELLIALLNAILNSDIVNLTIEKENLHRIHEDDKLGILDIKAKSKTGEKFNIEVQLVNQKNMVPRTLFYWAKLFAEDFESGQPYKELKKTVTINILGFKLDEIRHEFFHSVYKLSEIQSKHVLTNLMEIHFIEFPKFGETPYDLRNPLHQWLLFLKEDVDEQLLKEVTEMDVIINKAEEKLLQLSADPETRREYEARAKALSDERSRIEDARDEGREEGRKQGREEGREQGTLNMARKLLADGMPLAEVAKYTPYSIEELRERLRNLD